MAALCLQAQDPSQGQLSSYPVTASQFQTHAAVLCSVTLGLGLGLLSCHLALSLVLLIGALLENWESEKEEETCSFLFVFGGFPVYLQVLPASPSPDFHPSRNSSFLHQQL